MARVAKRKVSDANEDPLLSAKRQKRVSASPTNVAYSIITSSSYASLLAAPPPCYAAACTPASASSDESAPDSVPSPGPDDTGAASSSTPGLSPPPAPAKVGREPQQLAAGQVSYNAWRNERRKAGRRNVNLMMSRLDTLLPPPWRSTPSPNNAGGRAIGVQGRSLHDVLTDTVRYLTQLKQDSLLKKYGVEPTDVIKRGLQSSKSMLCVEVEGAKGDDACSITGMGQAAKGFFKHSPWGDVHGHSLSHFVKCDDVAGFHAIFKGSQVPRTCHTGPPPVNSTRLRLMHFHTAESDEGNAKEGWPPDSVQVSRVPSLDPSQDGLSCPFSFDPLLDSGPMSEGDGEVGPPHPDGPRGSHGASASGLPGTSFGSESPDPPALKCEYVTCDVQVHCVLAAPRGAVSVSSPSCSAACSASALASSPDAVPAADGAASLENGADGMRWQGGHGWKALVLARMHESMASDQECCVCGAGRGVGCSRSALRSLDPSMHEPSLRYKH